MDRKLQKSIVLIAARAFAEKLATPTLITDAIGNLVFYNEAAEAVLGRSFAQAGEMPASEWATMFKVRNVDGSPMALEEMPGGTALLEHKPAHGMLRFTSFDGVERTIATTGIPLFAREGHSVGVMAIFWPEDKSS